MRTSWPVSAGIHNPRDLGSTHTREPTSIVTRPRGAHASWWVPCRCSANRCPSASVKACTTMPPEPARSCRVADIRCHARPSLPRPGPPYVRWVNQQHLDILATAEWRQTLHDRVLPFAFGPFSAAQLGHDVLEIGPGPGMTTDLVRLLVPRLTSIEIDPTLAAALHARVTGTNVEVVEGDATAMPFDDGRFTGAVTFTMLHHVPTVELQDGVLREVLRVLRAGGLLVANDSVRSDDLEALHVDDTYNPVDPSTLESRLSA